MSNFGSCPLCGQKETPVGPTTGASISTDSRDTSFHIDNITNGKKSQSFYSDREQIKKALLSIVDERDGFLVFIPGMEPIVYDDPIGIISDMMEHLWGAEE